jgi:hypothetical protein
MVCSKSCCVSFTRGALGLEALTGFKGSLSLVINSCRISGRGGTMRQSHGNIQNSNIRSRFPYHRHGFILVRGCTKHSEPVPFKDGLDGFVE